MILRKIWKNRWILRSLLKSIFFNFYYLPFKQAIHLPILLYKPKFLGLKGTVKILSSSGNVKFGMIILGKYNVPLYPNSGFIFQNLGGNIIFRGNCSIGNASVVSIGEKGFLDVGANFSATTSLKLVSFHKIVIEENVLVGWNNTICDTDFHQLQLLNSDEKVPAYAPIKIGKGSWLAQNCITLKGTELQHYCVVATNSLLCKKYEIPQFSLIAGQPAILKKTGIFRDYNNDMLNY